MDLKSGGGIQDEEIRRVLVAELGSKALRLLESLTNKRLSDL